MASSADSTDQNDNNQFGEIVRLLGEAQEQGNLRSRCMPTGRVNFSLAPDALSAIIKTAGVEESQVTAVVEESGEIATVILREETDQFIQAKTATGPPTEETEKKKREKEEAEAKVRRRIETVGKVLITSRLRERYQSVLAAKHDVFASVDWEVTVRAYDADEGEEAKGPALVVELEYGRPTSGTYMNEALRAFFSPEPEYERLTFQCDEEDIKELVSTLDEARAKLAEYVKG